MHTPEDPMCNVWQRFAPAAPTAVSTPTTPHTSEGDDNDK
jgi:hypothetical protein